LANNKYKLSFSQSTGMDCVLRQRCNSIVVSNTYLGTVTLIEKEFTTLANVNYLVLDIRNGGQTTGTFTFSDISLKLKM
jgi:hypothetical protein